MTGHSGESVVLPCSCTELQDKPPQLTWTYTSLKHKRKPEEIYPNEQSERHRGRVKLLDQTSPGNLSLLISSLNTEDQGEYHCSVLQQQHVNIRLRVQGNFLLLLLWKSVKFVHKKLTVMTLSFIIICLIVLYYDWQLLNSAEELHFQSICLSIHKPAKEESTSTQHSGGISRKQPHNSP